MSNKYVRGLVIVGVGIAVLLALLFIGGLIAQARGAQGITWTPGSDGLLKWPVFWVLVGGVVLYLIYIFFAESDLVKVGTREVVMMALGAALYGVLTFAFNSVPVPSVSLVSLRPTVVIPIFFGFVFGPAVGFFTGAFGNVLGDAITGWGVFPIWDVGNGLMGLIPGLAGMYIMKRRGNLQVLLWVAVAALVLATVLLFVFPNIQDQNTGASLSIFQIVLPVIVVLTVGMALAPRYWPYAVALLTVGFIGWAVLEITKAGFSVFAIVLLVLAVVTGGIAFYLYQRRGDMAKWLEADDTRALVTWAAFGVVLGIGFSSLADIFYNGYSPQTAIVGEFIPAAGPNTLFAVILTPLVYAAYKQARAGMGR